MYLPSLFLLFLIPDLLSLMLFVASGPQIEHCNLLQMHLQSPPFPVAASLFSVVCKEVAWHSYAFATTKRKPVGALMFNQGCFLMQSKWPGALR